MSIDKRRLAKLEAAAKIIARPDFREACELTDAELEDILRRAAIELRVVWYPQDRSPTDDEIGRLAALFPETAEKTT
jgi:hypothetical protein